MCDDSFFRSLTQGGVTEEETRTAAAAAMKLSTDTFTAEKRAVSAEQRKQTLLNQSTIINSEKHVTSATQSKFTLKNQLALPALPFNDALVFEDLDSLGWESSTQDVERVIDKYSSELSCIVETLRDCDEDTGHSLTHLNYAFGVMKAAWKVPGHGHQVAAFPIYFLANGLQSSYGLFYSRSEGTCVIRSGKWAASTSSLETLILSERSSELRPPDY